MAFSPNGRSLAIGQRAVEVGPGKSGIRHVLPAPITLLDVPSGSARATLKGHAGDVATIAYSPDGKTLASGGHDGKVRLWDTDSGVQMATLEPNTDWVLGIAFSPDGRTLATAGYDQVLRLWHAAPLGFVTDREAWRLLRSLDDLVPGRDDLVERIRRETTVPEPVRLRALELLDQSGKERL